MNDILFFPFHKEKEWQSFRKENAKRFCQNPIITSPERLLPFQIRRENSNPILSVKINSTCGSTIYDLYTEANISFFKCAQTENDFLVYYLGDKLNFTRTGNQIEDLDMENGHYFVEIEFEDQSYYSELFEVRRNVDDLLKITIWNEGDIDPIIYNGINFKQYVYLDTYVHRTEPVVEIEGERDDRNELIPTFQKVTVSLIAEVILSDVFKNSLATVQIHDEVRIKDGNNKEFKPESIEITNEPEADGAKAVSTITIKRIILSKTNCATNTEILNDNIW